MGQELTGHEEALRDAKRIGEMLKDKYNIQPAEDQHGNKIMPPTMYDIKLEDLGKDSIMH